jgi:hypothetical protein
MKNRHVVIFGLLPLALFLIGAAAVSRDLVIQNASNAPGLTIIKPGSQTSNLIEAYIGSGSKLSLSRDGNMALNGYLSLSSATNRLTVADGALKLDGSAITGGASGDPFVITSELADNATNIALLVETDATWTPDSTGPFLFQGRNNGTNKVQIYASGAIGIGHPTSVATSNPEDNDFIITKDQDLGDRKMGVYWKWVNSDNRYQTFWVDLSNSSDTQMQLDADNTRSAHYWGAGTNYVYYSLAAGSTEHAIFWPTATAAATPYTLGTSVNHTSGNLLEVENNGTDKFKVAFSGAATAAQVAVEPTAPAAGFFTLFAIDNGSGKMVLKVRFPTGASQTVATEP